MKIEEMYSQLGFLDPRLFRLVAKFRNLQRLARGEMQVEQMGRRTGKTTQAVIDALLHAREEPVVFVTDSLAQTRRVQALIREYGQKLGIDPNSIEVSSANQRGRRYGIKRICDTSV
jgi:hypothetical protein